MSDGDCECFGGPATLRCRYCQGEEDARRAPVTPNDDWTPVTEGLPTEAGHYLITVRDDKYAKGSPFVDMDFFSHRKFEGDGVVAWMPLPEPWKGDE